MRILYGVQGTGNGHVARARAMASALQQHDVEVDFLFSGRKREKFFDMSVFGDFEVRKGLSFVTEKGRVDYFKTAINNNIARFWNEVLALDLSGYDLVINDFEPVTAWAAKRQGVPCVGISHQNAFRHSVPLKGASWLDKQMIEHFAPADHHVALHWYHFDQPILPPIIDVKPNGVKKEDFILVYLPFESLEEVESLLSRFGEQKFVCFHPDIHQVHKGSDIEWHPLSTRFHDYLLRCRGVMANGGFELPSEALSLGKKLLLKPLAGQFEQQSNVATLETLGLASVMESLDAGVVREWIASDDAESIRYPDVAAALADWLVSGQWHDQQSLHRTLWEQVDFPDYAAAM